MQDPVDLVGPELIGLALCAPVSAFVGVVVSPIYRILQAGLGDAGGRTWIWAGPADRGL
jgi:hypothetical protein